MTQRRQQILNYVTLASVIAMLILSNLLPIETAPLIRNKRTLLTALAVARGVSDVASNVVSRVSDDLGYNIDYTMDNGIGGTLMESLNSIPNAIQNIRLPFVGSLNLGGNGEGEGDAGINGQSGGDASFSDDYDSYDYAEY